MMERFLIISVCLLNPCLWAQQQVLGELLNTAYRQNPTLKALAQRQSAWEHKSAATSTLDDPRIGLAQLKRGNRTQYVSLSQKLSLPASYRLKQKRDSALAINFKQQGDQAKWDLRSEIISLAYRILACQRSIALARSDLTKIKEFSRIAETKYAAGTAPMQDSMKAHFAQTQIEAKLLTLEADLATSQAKLRQHLGPGQSRLDTRGWSDSPPTLVTELNPMPDNPDSSLRIKMQQSQLTSAQSSHQLSKWQYAPDFFLRYQGRIAGEPQDAHQISLEFSIPIIYGRSSDRERQSFHHAKDHEFRLQQIRWQVKGEYGALVSQVTTQKKLLSIYRTSLIPQAVTSYHAAIDAYKANKGSFLNLLDSERSLLQVRTDYFQSLVAFVDALTTLESLLGKTLAKFPAKEAA